MTPADTLALTANRLSALLRDTIRERLDAAERGEHMRADRLGEDVQAICDVIAYEADVILGTRYRMFGNYLAMCAEECTCAVGPNGYYGAHEHGCGWEAVLWFGVLDRLACPGCDVCRPVAVAA